MLTDRRLIWYEPSVARPLWPISGQITLSDIATVDQGTLFDLIGGGKLLRLRLRNRKDKVLTVLDGKRDEWIATIRGLIADVKDKR